jgi:hypothetical protein
MKKQKIKIHVDHLGFPDSNQFPFGFKEKLIESVDTAKNSKIWKDHPDQTDSFLKGRRYNDSDRVARCILANIATSHKHINEDDRHITVYTYIEKLNDEDLTMWVDSALHYSGGCDHWYTFEKDWG